MNDGLMKVIAGLECCKDAENMVCDMCPYDDGKGTSGDCMGVLMSDVLEILREVEICGMI